MEKVRLFVGWKVEIDDIHIFRQEDGCFIHGTQLKAIVIHGCLLRIREDAMAHRA